MEKKTAVIDRIDEGIATVIPDDGSEIITLPLPEGFAEGQTVIIENGAVRHANEDESPPRNNKERLRNLFNKSKRSN
ncbi:MAG: DUF3006 domain-containing protein [Clostridia bacterium]|nr:DUF3006 domain-containing protein [Clostridia bacterium]